MSEKKLSSLFAQAALAGLAAGATLFASCASSGDKAPGHEKNGCNGAAKTSCNGKDSCQGKDSCNGKESCKAKDSCNGKDSCEAKSG